MVKKPGLEMDAVMSELDLSYNSRYKVRRWGRRGKLPAASFPLPTSFHSHTLTEMSHA